MKFFVTDKYKLVDPGNKFKTLSPEKQSDLLFDATDIYEKHMGKAKQKDFPEVVVRKIMKSSALGVIEL